VCGTCSSCYWVLCALTRSVCTAPVASESPVCTSPVLFIRVLCAHPRSVCIAPVALKVQCVRHLFLFIRVPFAHAPFFKSSVHSICSVNVESNCAFGMGTADGLNCKSTKCSIALICYRLINSAMKQGIAHLAKPLARRQNLCVLLCCKIFFVHLKFASCVNLVQIFVSMRSLIFLQRLFRKCLLLIPFQRDCC
jgi:hypothetical protein